VKRRALLVSKSKVESLITKIVSRVTTVELVLDGLGVAGVLDELAGDEFALGMLAGDASIGGALGAGNAGGAAIAGNASLGGGTGAGR
jgi:hypothetical protein